MTKYEVDQELEAWVGVDGAKGVLFNDEVTRELLSRAMSEAFSTPEGCDLRARVGDSFNQKLIAELTKRSGSRPLYPGVFFRSLIEECIHDLLLVAPPAPQRKPGVNRYGVNLGIDRASDSQRPAPTKEQAAFAHAWEKTVRERGIQAVKPKGGVVTLFMPNGATYDYKAKEADRLLNECIALGLINVVREEDFYR